MRWRTNTVLDPLARPSNLGASLDPGLRQPLCNAISHEKDLLNDVTKILFPLLFILDSGIRTLKLVVNPGSTHSFKSTTLV